MKKIALIGSTGSIGVQTLNVVRRYPDKFKIVSLAAGKNAALLAEQVKEFKPEIATAAGCSEEYLSVIKQNVRDFTVGENAFINAITAEADVVVIALVGFTGIIAVLDAMNKGKNIALANKESLVVGGDIVMKKAREKGVNIVPIDSEHSAIWQALSFDFNRPFKKIILTASGGAFRDKTEEELKTATAADALRHPNWAMGAKITVDCATMVNKAFEVIEAKWLYSAPFDKIDVIIHRESIIHSMVEYEDGSTIAQMSYPTMELPIQIALSYPERLNPAVDSLNFAKISKLTFSELDKKRFPAFKEVVSAGKKGGAYPAVANGANDALTKLFLENKIGFTDIYAGISGALNAYSGDYFGDFETLKAANDFAARFVKNKYGE
ncbi:MAG: 1-deoxy-D-xylulose-5-phosphate reductoisomerase [Clostridia bacterium]|nr:1-deoxy-D-xylulose-5-phosphate reductoisomerase [Clostridia bacterium]